MTKNYLNNQAAKKSFARKFIILLVILAVILAIVFSHIAMPDNNFLSGNVPPDNKQVYAIAKEFIRPDINSQAVTFPDSGYQCARKSDSVYVVKSYAESQDPSGKKSTMSFEITLKYTGGHAGDKNSWKQIGLTLN